MSTLSNSGNVFKAWFAKSAFPALFLSLFIAGCGEKEEIAQKPLVRSKITASSDKTEIKRNLEELLVANAVRVEFDFFSRWRDGGSKKTVPCSGVLVSGGKVVTARHCLFDNGDVINGKRADSARAYFRADGLLSSETSIDLVSKFGEEKLGPYYEIEQFDLAILILEEDDALNDYRFAQTASPVDRVAPGDSLFHVYWDKEADDFGVTLSCRAKEGVRSEQDGLPPRRSNFSHTCAEGDGVSGSPLFNSDLELVGIHVGKLKSDGTKVAARVGDAWERAYSENYKDAFGKLSCDFGDDDDCLPIIDDTVEYAGVGLCVNAIRALNLDFSQYADEGETNESFVSQRINFSNFNGYDELNCEAFGSFFARAQTTRCDYPIALSSKTDLDAELDTIMQEIDGCFDTANAQVPITPAVVRTVRKNQVCTREGNEGRNDLPPHQQRQCINRVTGKQGPAQMIGDTPARLTLIDNRRHLYVALGHDDEEGRGYLSFIGIDSTDMQKVKRRTVFDVR